MLRYENNFFKKLISNRFTYLILFSICCCSSNSNDPKPDNDNNDDGTDPDIIETINPDVWIASNLLSDNFNNTKVHVWFESQLIDFEENYNNVTSQYTQQGRLSLRNLLMSQLKELNSNSMIQVEMKLDSIENLGKISNVNSTWIVNGFDCLVDPGGITALSNIPGVHSIFKAQISTANLNETGPKYCNPNSSDFVYDDINDIPNWNIDSLKVKEVWNQYGITGEGVKHVVHDVGFTFDLPIICNSVYTNSNEIPDNQIDDDENGYIDDYHGFNFEHQNATINTGIPNSLGAIHGNSVAALISGKRIGNKVYGIAPNSKWAGVLALSTFAEAIEWSIEMGFDTYTMSFSIPNLGEHRSYWRKITEHASLCGLFIISGAGNFGNNSTIPIQLRTPEDIPYSVTSVSGVDNEEILPDFSSQGPVFWDLYHYNEGEVNKPDFATFNVNIPSIDSQGNGGVMLNGNSMAGPQLAGVVALILEANPNLNVWEIRDILINSSTDILESGFDNKAGYGLINALEAVTNAY
ncbi:S8 family serine peptidase [uncultured Psychroserpens sp.]|uniref:S8 family peptidase n=1 Tax=uncultured Psychroserpens sp. TaxID=255436 RepID=UPI002613B263|nr:S8 family serine peptidase [uncultured Psychroserpens sp.]